MPQDPFIREKFTRLRQAAKKLAAEYFERFQKHRYQTEIGSWRHLQSDNIEFIMKRSANRSTPTITCKKAQVDALHCRKDHAGLPRPQVPTQCVYQDAAGGAAYAIAFRTTSQEWLRTPARRERAYTEPGGYIRRCRNSPRNNRRRKRRG